MSESDGIEESLENQMRVSAMVMMQAGERIARMNRERIERQRQLTEQQAQQDQARFNAERASAVAELAVIRNSDWWDNATPEEIGNTYATARGWAEHDPQAAEAERFIREQVRERYGTDISQASLAETEQSAAATERGVAVEHDAAARAAEAQAEADLTASHQTTDPAEAEQLRSSSEADQNYADDRNEQASQSYDSAERREATAARMRSAGGSEELIDTRMRADVSQGQPAHQAVANPPRGQASASTGRTAPRGRQAQRTR